MVNTIEQILHSSESISYLDLHFARLMLRLAGFSSDAIPQRDDIAAAALFLAAALVSSQTQQGHICFDLTELEDEQFLLEKFGPDWQKITIPSLQAIVSILKECSIVGEPGDFQPLILDSQNRLYLNRYWGYQEQLSQFIKNRTKLTNKIKDLPKLQESLSKYFAGANPQEFDWQKIAAVVAMLKKFCVITGGPGTGKTHTVAKIIALLLEQSPTPQELHIALAAPTGKAAVRLQDSINRVKATLDCADDIKAAIPEEASTVHRLLGYISHSPYFRYNRNHRLEVDIMIVDEASMVDLALLAKLVEALPDDARLILLGDNNQLASVEAGAVLGDICDTGRLHHFSKDLAQTIESTSGESLPNPARPETPSGIQDCIIQLQKSYRFESQKGIGALSQAVNSGNAERALEILHGSGFDDVEWHSPDSMNIIQNILQGFRGYTENQDVSAIFSRFEKFRILCAVRQGPYGVNTINDEIEKFIKRQLKIKTGEIWYATQPVLITENDYSLQLFNGDVGIIMPDAETGDLMAFFPTGERLHKPSEVWNRSFRKLRPFRLPQHETAYAMTVHKSQGSEFENVLLVLPDKDSPILTRELLYTGISRAIKKVAIWSNETIFSIAVSRRIKRASGLRDALWEA